MKKWTFLFLLVLFLTACVIGVRYLFFPSPTLTLSASSEIPKTLEISFSNINGLTFVEFYSASNQEFLWNLDLNANRARAPKKITYGAVPTAGKQIFPRDGKPRPIEDGETFVVRVYFDYDSMFPFGVFSARKEFVFTNLNGTWKEVRGYEGDIVPP
jgi:hypothetical protein